MTFRTLAREAYLCCPRLRFALWKARRIGVGSSFRNANQTALLHGQRDSLDSRRGQAQVEPEIFR